LKVWLIEWSKLKNRVSGMEDKEEELAKPQWLMPIILASQEAEIRRIMVQSQPRKIVPENLS
jgi:hypothetical protein